jgi:hypothetical protein
MTIRDIQGRVFQPGFIADIPTGNLLWVDAVNGVDALAARGRMTIPFKTLTAAKNAAASGDTIIVLPGTYPEKNLLKNGVNWHFFTGAKVSYSGSDGGGIFDTGPDGTGSAVVSKITGFGVFERFNTVSTGHVVYSYASGSDLVIHARSLAAQSASCVKTLNGDGKLEIQVSGDISGTVGRAVDIGGTAGSNNVNIIRAYRLHSSSSPGLDVSGGNVDVIAQYVSSTGDAGIKVAGGSGSNIVVRAYEISASTTSGIHYNAASNPLLTILGAL